LAHFDAFIDSAASPEPARRTRLMTIIAQDPRVRYGDRIARACVPVPVDRLEPGPRSSRFHVVDYDASAGLLHDPVDLTDPAVDMAVRAWSYRDRFLDAADETLLEDPAFRAQNVYAIAARTLAVFEFALGRRIEWQFGGHQLYVVPRAFAEGNAHYSREDHGLFFGYLPGGPDGTVHTCLSHDIVCHETTHAVLDGLRPRFMEPSLPDQAAFHESLGDIVAMLSVFSLRELVEASLGEADAEGRIAAAALAPEELAGGVLLGLAEQFGEATSGVRGSALRRSLHLPPGENWRADPAFDEPHRRGEVLVAAVLRALVAMWTRRIDELVAHEALNRRRAAEEGAKAAAHLLTMVIRALDYAPAVELEFEDVLDAVLVADEVVAPDDEHDYRGAVREAFAAYGIRQPAGRTIDLAGVASRFTYDHVNAAALRSSPEEAFRFVWQHLASLDLKPDYNLTIEALRPAVRVGPDGLIVNEVVADYVQVVDVTAAQARAEPEMTVPDDLPDDVEIQLWGGGTLIFDQFGRVKLHQRKALHDWGRQSRRLEHLVRHGRFDTRGRLGFSTGAAPGSAFAELHTPNDRAGEDW
jgi:hypothetical protein